MATSLTLPKLPTGESADMYMGKLATSNNPEIRILAEVLRIIMMRIDSIDRVLRLPVPFPNTLFVQDLTVGELRTIAVVAGTADAAYSANEVTLINDLKTAVNAILTALKPT